MGKKRREKGKRETKGGRRRRLATQVGWVLFNGWGDTGGTNELNKPLNKSQCTLIHVGDRKRDDRARIQMSAKWQESSDGNAEEGVRQREQGRVKWGQNVSLADRLRETGREEEEEEEEQQCNRLDDGLRVQRTRSSKRREEWRWEGSSEMISEKKLTAYTVLCHLNQGDVSYKEKTVKLKRYDEWGENTEKDRKRIFCREV